MAAFDWVKFNCECPKCGGILGSFQTYDGPGTGLNLTVGDVKNFYTECQECGFWIEAYDKGDFLLLEAYPSPYIQKEPKIITQIIKGC